MTRSKCGGQPDTDSLELWVVKVVRREGEVHVAVGCAFDKVVPTGCRDFPLIEPATGDFAVVLETQCDTAYLDDGEEAD